MTVSRTKINAALSLVSEYRSNLDRIVYAVEAFRDALDHAESTLEEDDSTDALDLRDLVGEYDDEAFTAAEEIEGGLLDLGALPFLASVED